MLSVVNEWGRKRPVRCQASDTVATFDALLRRKFRVQKAESAAAPRVLLRAGQVVAELSAASGAATPAAAMSLHELGVNDNDMLHWLPADQAAAHAE